LALLATVTALGAWRVFAIYWVVPLLCWIPGILRLRSFAEHWKLEASPDQPARTRTIVPTLVERIVLAPANVWLHGAHHTLVSVPYYRLPEAHHALMRTEFAKTAVITRTYWQLFASPAV
jgi:fatty acid desaturase